MKAIRDIHFFFQEGSQKMKYNQPVPLYTAMMIRVCAAIKFSETTVEPH
jgi:hypothetical protein